jgi:hypothetical protein
MHDNIASIPVVNLFNKTDMFILKVKGKAKIPDYVQLRDSNFVLVAYFRADRPLKEMDRFGLDGHEEALSRLISDTPFGKLELIPFGNREN